MIATMTCSQGFRNQEQDAIRVRVTNKVATMLCGLETDTSNLVGPSPREDPWCPIAQRVTCTST